MGQVFNIYIFANQTSIKIDLLQYVNFDDILSHVDSCWRILFPGAQTIPNPWTINQFLSRVLKASFQSNPHPLVSFIYIGHKKTKAQVGIELITPWSEK